MQSTSKEELADMLRFVERQIEFTLNTTAQVETYHYFLTTQEGMILFNSTCMCLQTIGGTIRQVDDRTHGQLFVLYPDTPWKKVIEMRNIILYEYLAIDPQVIFATVKTRLQPLLMSIRRVLADIDAGLRDNELIAEN